MTLVSRYENRYFSSIAPRPITSEKNIPRYSKSMPKGVKKHAESDPDYKNRTNIESEENIHMFNVFSTSDNRFSPQFPSRTAMISNLKSDDGI